MSLNKTPCFEVDNNNINRAWPHLISCLNSCQFIAFDFEFSGLGCLKDLKISNIEDRYKAFSKIAKTHSIISVGVSCFKYTLQDVDIIPQWTFKVQTFNIFTHCLDEYILDKQAVEFLINHGFDFEKQKNFGLTYSKGFHKEDESYSIRSLFNHILSKKIPIILHNGFLDLIFLYQHFYCDLPSKLNTFLADLSKMFPKGIYDTKHIVENVHNNLISYLEYVFYKRQRINLKKQFSSKSHIKILFPEENDEIKPFLKIRNLQTIILSKKPKNLKICQDYRIQGWCKNGKDCQNSHNIDYILDQEEKNIYFVKKQKLLNYLKNSNLITNHVTDSLENEEKNSSEAQFNEKLISGIHQSGFDAFMTGFCFASFLSSKTESKPQNTSFNFNNLGLKQSLNHIHLIGKNVPLLIRKSKFASTSAASDEKLKLIRSNKNSKFKK